MADCSNLEPLFTSYVDGEAGPAECEAFDTHLRHCPSCRDRVGAERAVRQAISERRESLRSCASADLKRRCGAGVPGRADAVRTATFRRPTGWRRVAWVPLSLAATLLLAIGGVFLYGLRGGSEALAAQLVVDHMKCFEFAPEPTILPDPRALGHEWGTLRGWNLKVPESTDVEKLELLGLRRCLSTDGLTAHVMYKWHGQPLSLFVLNNDRKQIGPVPQLVERFGQEAIMWSKGGRTYAVVARGRPNEVEHVARYVQTTAE